MTIDSDHGGQEAPLTAPEPDATGPSKTFQDRGYDVGTRGWRKQEVTEVSPVDRPSVRPITPPGRIAMDGPPLFSLRTGDPGFDPESPVMINGYRFVPATRGGEPT